MVLAGVQRRRRYRPGRTASTSLGPGEPPLPAVISALRRAAARHPAASTSARPLARPAPGPGSLPRPGPPGAGPGRGDHAHGTDPHGHDPASSPQAPGGGSGLPHAAAGVMPPSAAFPQAPVPAEPGTVPLGIRDGREVSAGIAAMGGLGLTGPGAAAAARAILAALLTQGLPGQPPGPAEVIITADALSVLLPGPGAIRVPGVTVTATLEQALGLAEALLVRRARIQESSDDPCAGPGTVARPVPAAAALIAVAPRAGGRRRGVLAGRAAPPWRGCCSVTGWGSPAGSPPAAPSPPPIPSWMASSCSISPPPIPPRCSASSRPPAAPRPVSTTPHRSPAAPSRPGPLARHPASPRLLPAASRCRHLPLRAERTRPGTSRQTRRQSPLAAPPARPGRTRRRARRSRPAPPPAHTQALASPPHGPHPGNPGPQVTLASRSRTGPHRIPQAGGSSGWRSSARCGSPPAGQEIGGGLRKARELAAFLAVHPDGVTGEAISEALWPGSTPGHGAAPAQPRAAQGSATCSAPRPG